MPIPDHHQPAPPPEPPRVLLQPLTDVEYADFAARQLHEQARQRLNAGEFLDDAPAFAREALADLLADRLRGAGHHFFKGVRIGEPGDGVTGDGARVGWIWVAPMPPGLGPGHERTRWLAQITVDEPLRGQGFGRALLDALHADLRREGVEKLWLRVYDWNTVARRLYTALGYELVRQFATDAHLRKRLLDPASQR